MKRFAPFAISVCLLAQSPSQLKQDGKDAAKVQQLLLHQILDAAKIQAIFDRKAAELHCESHAAGRDNRTGMIACIPVEQTPRAATPPLPPPNTTTNR